MRGTFSDLTGHRFHRLTVIQRNGVDRNRNVRWLCRCDCGNEITTRGFALTGGQTKSCGCYMRDVNARLIRDRSVTHDLSQSPEYKIYQAIIQRCTNPKNKSYKDYGGRGILLCDRWRQGFENFISDVGRRPTKSHLLDRRNNNGHYEPGNVHWTSRIRQGRNKRNNVLITHDEKNLPMSEWAEIKGIPYGTLWARLNYLRWSISDAIETPVQTVIPR